jgi:hypothetical protein
LEKFKDVFYKNPRIQLIYGIIRPNRSTPTVDWVYVAGSWVHGFTLNQGHRFLDLQLGSYSAELVRGSVTSLCGGTMGLR